MANENLVEASPHALPGISFLVNVQPICAGRPIAPSGGCGDAASVAGGAPDILNLARAFGDLVGAALRGTHR